MNINFEKTDRLIELIDESCHVLTHFSWEAENSLQKKHKNLYENLTAITTSNKSEKEKQAERIKAFGKEYKLGDDLAKAEAFSKIEFNEEEVLEYLTRSYWQIQSFVKFTDNSGNNFANREDLKKLIEKTHPSEPCKDVLIDVIVRQEPKIKDIEKEFWTNCTETNKINDFCNIYRERWRNHLKEVDEKYYSLNSILFDEQNDLHNYFKDLRQCGLLQQEEFYIEGRLSWIAREINIICKDVVKLFKGFQAATIPTLSNDKNNVEEKPPHRERRGQVEKKEENLTLKDIWLEKDAHFDNVIEYLKEENSTFQRPWIKEDNGNFIWLGKIAHARALAHILRKHRFIDPKISGDKVIKVFNNTFSELGVSPKSVSEWLESTPVNPRHLEEFSAIPLK